ncbi:MAG: hypothetical protein KDJ99_24770 [Candidatus Competibacteraceae bacterium]|nr:hypothetical protein [Candidatus Competibacteraceae bacterium]
METLWGILALGILASGGSGLWNSIFEYLNGIKKLKKMESKKQQKAGDYVKPISDVSNVS